MENKVRLIDANALTSLEDLEYYYQPVRDGEAWYRVADVWACIDSAPTIDPESLRPKGKWKLNKDGSGTCSVCHRTRSDVWDMDNWDNYCSRCGADMRGESK